MKTKFKFIAGVLAAAALSTGIVASAATVSDTAEIVTAEEDISKLDAFELALLEGKSPNVRHARELTDEIIQNSEVSSIYFNIAAEISNGDGYKLQKIHGPNAESTYTLWSGRFIVSNVSKFANEFNEPSTFKCETSGINKAASMTGKRGYYGNYKMLTTYGTFRDSNGNTYTRNFSNNGTNETIIAPLLFTGGGELVELACYFYLYNGTGQEANYLEVAVVHIVGEDYANSAEYAKKPYAGLIDCYTYVDTDSLGVLPPVGY